MKIDRLTIPNLFRLAISACIIQIICVSGIAAQDGSPKGYVPFEDLYSHKGYQLDVQEKKDSLKFILNKRWTLGLRYGLFFIPGGLKTNSDSITGIDLSKNKVNWALHTNYYVSEKWALGFELNFNSAERVIEISQLANSASIRGGGGFNYGLLLTATHIWGTPQKAIKGCRPYTRSVTGTEVEEYIGKMNELNSKRMRKFRVYNSFGAGMTQTVLLKVKGSMTALSTRSYLQAVPSLFAGIGVFSRFSRNIIFDMHCRYMASKPYKPYIGEVKSYSGFNGQLSLAFILNNGLKGEKEKLSAQYIR